MLRTRSAFLLFAAAAACVNTEAPTAVNGPLLARPGASGVQILDLGTLGGNQSYARALNTPAAGDRVLVVGSSHPLNESERASYWYVDVATRQIEKGYLPALDSGGQSAASDVNRSGQIAGWTYVRNADGSNAGQRAIHWLKSSTGWTALRLPTLSESRYEATAINEQGWIVGTSPTPAGEPHFYLSDGATAMDRGAIGAGGGFATDVNRQGTLVGQFNSSPRAFVGEPGSSAVLLPDYGAGSGARAINDSGVIVGYARNAAGESRAVRWKKAATTGEYAVEDLGLTNATANDINNRGEMTGTFIGRQRTRAFYMTANKSFRELPILSYDAFAYAINEDAQIVGKSTFRNIYDHAVLWINVR